MGTLYRQVLWLSPGMSGADIEDTSASPKFEPGCVVDIKTEFGFARAKYIRNHMTTSTYKGYVMGQDVRSIPLNGGGATTWFSATNTTGRGTDDLWVGALAFCSTAGGAAPANEVATIIRNVSGSTDYFYLDRALSATISSGDVMELVHPWGYEHVANSIQAIRVQPGFVCASSLAAKYYGWIIIDGVHPSCYMLKSHVQTTVTGCKLSTTAGLITSSATTNLVAFPLAKCVATAGSHFPMIVRIKP